MQDLIIREGGRFLKLVNFGPREQSLNNLFYFILKKNYFVIHTTRHFYRQNKTNTKC